MRNISRTVNAKSAGESRILGETTRIFAPESLTEILRPALPTADSPSSTDSIALEWASVGGKRLRPFITLAAYVAAKHGAAALVDGHKDHARLIPPAVKSIAVAIEMLHKASLVHDDIEDNDAFRYGRATLHKTYGTAPALNIGDYLIGLGYRLVTAQKDALGADCVADIVAHLSAAHIELCRGQGEELFWRQREMNDLKPADVLSIYSLKTAPAFEVALYAGLRSASVDIDSELLRQFSRHIGEAYQIMNDLDDWHGDDNKMIDGLDAMANRPTLLRALAVEAGAGARLEGAARNSGLIGQIYHEAGVFDKAEQFVGERRAQASALAEGAGSLALGGLLRFIIGAIL